MTSGDPSFRAGGAEPVTHGDTTSPPSLRVDLENSSPLGAAIYCSNIRSAHPRRLKVIGQIRMTSNHVISTVALIGLIMSTSYFQNLS